MAEGEFEDVKREEVEEVADGRPLRRICESFQKLAKILEEGGDALPTDAFAQACAEITIMFRLLGVAFKFAEGDYVSKVNDLAGAASTYLDITQMVDADVKEGTVRTVNSHTRNLLRVKRGVEMMKILFEELLKDRSLSLKEAASRAYKAAFSPYHSWTIRKAVSVGLLTLPNKFAFLKKLKEDESTWADIARGYVHGAEVTLTHVEGLYISRNLGIDW